MSHLREATHDVPKVVDEIRPLIKDLPDGTVVAVMGCEVNGPREAMEADIGIAGAPDGIIIFKKGEVIKHLAKDDLRKIDLFFKELL